MAERDAVVAEHEKQIRELDGELLSLRETLRGREDTIASLHKVLADRDHRIEAMRGDIEEIERQNTGYQEQVLRAYQKIKSDETTVARAKKALAIALTLLDDSEEAQPSRDGE